MVRYKTIILGLFVALSMSVLGVQAVNAASVFKTGDDVTVQEGNIDGSLYVAGNNVTIKGMIDGDVYCAGQNVTVSAVVKGDVLCAGQNVRVEGDIEGDARLAGQNVVLVGTVKKSATIAGQSLQVEQGGSVGRDLTATGTQLTLSGTVARDAIINANKIDIKGSVGRETIKDKLDQKDTQPMGEFSWLATWFYTTLAFLVVSLLLAFLFPRQLKQAGERVDDHPVQTFFTGLALSIIAPVVIVLLFLTLIGIPLAILLILVWVLFLFISGPIAGFALGKLLLRNKGGVVVTALVGGAALFTLYFVPLLGVLIALLAPCFGLGAAAIELYRRMGTSRVQSVSSKTRKKKK